MFRVAAIATSLLCLIAQFAAASALEQPQRLASLALDIPGLTYPRTAPPDLVASAAPGDIEMPDAVTPGAAAAAGGLPAEIPATLTLEVRLAVPRQTGAEWLNPQWANATWHAFGSDFVPTPHAVFFHTGSLSTIQATP